MGVYPSYYVDRRHCMLLWINLFWAEGHLAYCTMKTVIVSSVEFTFRNCWKTIEFFFPYSMNPYLSYEDVCSHKSEKLVNFTRVLTTAFQQDTSRDAFAGGGQAE